VARAVQLDLAFELLELLGERERGAPSGRKRRLEPPPALDLRRHVPEVDLARAFDPDRLVGRGDRFGEVRLPLLAQVPVVGDDARAGPQLLEDARPKLDVELPEEIERKHGGRPQVRDEQVVGNELDAVGDARAAGVVITEIDEIGLDLDAQAARAELRRRGDHDPAVAGPEIDDVVVRADPRELEHPVDRRLRRRNVRRLREEHLRRRAGAGEQAGRREDEGEPLRVDEQRDHRARRA
jgi:hypothetical protein